MTKTQKPAVTRRTLRRSPASAARKSRMHSVSIFKNTHSLDTPLQRSLSKPLPKELAITPVGANPLLGKDATDDPQAVPAAPTAPTAPAASHPSPATLTQKSKSKRHKRHHHSRSRDHSFTTMIPTPSKREVKWIKRGDRPQQCTGAGEVQVNYLPVFFSVLCCSYPESTTSCSGKLQPETINRPPTEMH